jgi:hypothetical protein
LVLWKHKQGWQTLAKLTKTKRENTQINITRAEKGILQQITMKSRRSLAIYQNLIFQRIGNLEEVDEWSIKTELRWYKQPKKSVTSNENEAVKVFQQK